jgi:hypothetical protein
MQIVPDRRASVGRAPCPAAKVDLERYRKALQCNALPCTPFTLPTALNKKGSSKDDLSGLTPLEFVQYPARLPLRKLEGEVSKYFAGIREFLPAKRQSRDGCAGLTVMKSFMTFYQNRPDVRLICVENSTEKICEKKNGALAFTESTVNSTQPIAHCCKMRGQRRFSVDSFWSIFIDKMGV